MTVCVCACAPVSTIPQTRADSTQTAKYTRVCASFSESHLFLTSHFSSCASDTSTPYCLSQIVLYMVDTVNSPLPCNDNHTL